MTAQKYTFSRRVSVIHNSAMLPIFKTKYTEIKAIFMSLFLSKYLHQILVDNVLILCPRIILSCVYVCQLGTKLKFQPMI